MVDTSSKSIENSLNRALVRAVTSGKDAQLPEVKDTARQMVDTSSKSIENSLNRALVRAVTSGKDAQPPEIEDTAHQMVDTSSKSIENPLNRALVEGMVTSAKDAQPPEIEDTARQINERAMSNSCTPGDLSSKTPFETSTKDPTPSNAIQPSNEVERVKEELQGNSGLEFMNGPLRSGPQSKSTYNLDSDLLLQVRSRSAFGVDWTSSVWTWARPGLSGPGLDLGQCIEGRVDIQGSLPSPASLLCGSRTSSVYCSTCAVVDGLFRGGFVAIRGAFVKIGKFK
ncbi:hypothetical protein JOM56_012376 [Amanita muscaria]